MEIKAEPRLTGKGGQTTEPQAYQLSIIYAWRPEYLEPAVPSGLHRISPERLPTTRTFSRHPVLVPKGCWFSHERGAALVARGMFQVQDGHRCTISVHSSRLDVRCRPNGHIPTSRLERSRKRQTLTRAHPSALIVVSSIC
jgi:hypothetical protein